MPKPPLLVAPSPNETIASQTWGVPVTDMVNGLTTGAEMIGCLVWTLAANQNLSSGTLVTLSIPTPLYDSDGFFNPAVNTQLVVPPGLDGIYEVFWALQTPSASADSTWRMHLTRNGTRFISDSRKVDSTAPAGCQCRAILPLYAGDAIVATISQSGASVAATMKQVMLRRIGDIPAAYEEAEPPADNPEATPAE